MGGIEVKEGEGQGKWEGRRGEIIRCINGEEDKAETEYERA